MIEFPFDISGVLSINSQSIAYFIFFLVAFFTALVSAIMFFHWQKYSMKGSDFIVGEFIYVIGSVALLALAFFNIS